MTIKKIYLPEEIEKEGLDYGFIDTDVIVQLDNGGKYKAHFMAIKKLVDDFQTYQETAADPIKKYLWSKSMVLVDDMEKKDLFPMIEYMIQEGDFQMIFEKLS